MLVLYLAIIDDADERVKFEKLYYKYRKRMVYEAYLVLHNNADAEDAVHDTFIKIARNMKSIGDPDSNKTLWYVLKAVKNTAINILHKNEKLTSFAEFGDVEKTSDESFYEQLGISENYKEVVDAIRRLNDTYRDAMFYYFVCEMKPSEIADLLGRKNSAVRQQLIRGKKKLIETLEAEKRV